LFGAGGGMVEILDYVAVDDAGTIINPLLATGQIHGGVVQGRAWIARDQFNRGTRGEGRKYGAQSWWKLAPGT
jgi:CO/xanthine dehydrogenase Mo-binding subunit